MCTDCCYCFKMRAEVLMSTPNKGKKIAVEVDKSPRNFRWAQPFEDTLLDLLVRETRNGNRPDATFTASAFRNVVTDFNSIHGTSIMKKHVLSRIKTMKQHFTQFHRAFHGLSGFAWNHESKMFEAEESLWEERIKVRFFKLSVYITSSIRVQCILH